MKKKSVANRGRRLPSRELCRLMALNAGTEVFAIDGLHAASMDEVARLAGFTKPILYQLYPSKDKLFQAVVEAESELLVQHLLAAYARSADLPLLERYREGTRAIVDYARKRPKGFRLLFQTSNHSSSTIALQVERTRRRLTDHIASVYRASFKQNDRPDGQIADILATMVVSINIGVVQRLMTEPKWNVDNVVNLLAEYLNAAAVHTPREAQLKANISGENSLLSTTVTMPAAQSKPRKTKPATEQSTESRRTKRTAKGQ